MLPLIETINQQLINYFDLFDRYDILWNKISICIYVDMSIIHKPTYVCISYSSPIYYPQKSIRVKDKYLQWKRSATVYI